MRNIESNTNSATERINPIHSEHLKDGINPIFACVGNPKQFEENPSLATMLFSGDRLKYRAEINKRIADLGVTNVDWFGDPSFQKKHGMKNEGSASFVISKLDGTDKFSSEFYSCLGLLATGKDKATGKDLSFLAHVSVYHLFGDAKDAFTIFGSAIRGSLNELRDKSADGTVDIVIFGGDFNSDTPRGRKNILILLNSWLKKLEMSSVLSLW